MLCLKGGKVKQSYYLYKSGRLQRKDNTLEIVYKDATKKEKQCMGNCGRYRL